MKRWRQLVRLVLEGALVLLMVGSLALAGLARVAPALGHPTFIIRSGSMAPTIPVGAVVMVDPGAVSHLQPGDVVTMRLDNGALFTHRVTRLAELDGAAWIETKGDANAAVDPTLTRVDRVLGRVTTVLPVIGFLMVGLGTVPGAVTILLAALTLLAAIWLLDDEDDPVAQPAPGLVGEPEWAGWPRRGEVA